MSDPSVFVIEDDAVLRRGLEDNFRMQGYRVRSADNGESGLQAVLAEPADLILLDIMLPKLNGFEICRRIRQTDRETTIIMLTAKGQEDDIVRGLELGADDYLTKPFSIRELLARAKSFLRRKLEPQGQQTRFGEYMFDSTTHRLLRQNQEVELTAKEFRLLEYFISRQGRALTRNEILNHVWGSRIIVTDRSVDRCVTTLRSKIEADPRHPIWIRTIRDVGYRFEIEFK